MTTNTDYTVTVSSLNCTQFRNDCETWGVGVPSTNPNCQQTNYLNAFVTRVVRNQSSIYLNSAKTIASPTTRFDEIFERIFISTFVNRNAPHIISSCVCIVRWRSILIHIHTQSSLLFWICSLHIISFLFDKKIFRTQKLFPSICFNLFVFSQLRHRKRCDAVSHQKCFSTKKLLLIICCAFRCS